jgi:hypothetical protein
MTPSDLPTVVMIAMGSIDISQMEGRDRRTITRRMQKELRKYGLRLTRIYDHIYFVKSTALDGTPFEPRDNGMRGPLHLVCRWALRYLERYHETQ